MRLRRTWMVSGSRNALRNRKRTENRRKKVIRWLSLLAKVSILVAIVFCIRNIYTRLEEMQVELERLGIQQYGMEQTSADEQSLDKLNDVDDVDSLGTWEVGKPTERTEAEVLQRLGELGQTSSLIEGMCQNYSQYPKELLAALANNPEMADFVSGYPERHGRGQGNGGRRFLTARSRACWMGKGCL